MPSRRDLFRAGGTAVTGGLTGAALASPPAGSSPPLPAGGAAAPVPRPNDDELTATTRPDTPFRKGGPGPLYWSTYGYSNATNSQIPESVWKANIDWVAQELAPAGFRMVCTDGWIDDTQRVTDHGYIRSLSDDWEHDWAWWAEYLHSKGMELGVYYNPLWATKSAVSDRSVRVAGRPDVAVADLVNPNDWFDGGGQLQWIDATKDGAEEYVKGYVEYFRSVGAVFLRVDFLGWYEIGYDQSEGTVCVGHGRESYVRALQWMHDATGSDMQLSLVMPNLFDHAAVERQYGDLIRIDNDVSFGSWINLSEGRQTWQPIWSQWNNPFEGFTGFSDVAGAGQLILDGDPLFMSSFANDGERQSAINLFTMAGAALAVADQYDTIGPDAPFFQNEEVLAVHRAGLVGKPVPSNAHAYEYDQTSRDPERWVGQLPDGSWVVGLFNRTDGPVVRTVDFATTLGLTRPAPVRDLWAHQDVGTLGSWSVTLGPHASSLVKVTPQEPARYLAEMGAFGGSARFDDTHGGHSGLGYVTGLDTEGSSVGIALAASGPGARTLRCRVANGTGRPATLTLSVQDAHSGASRGSHRLSVPPSTDWSAWHDVSVPVSLGSGTNLVLLSHEGDDTGTADVDSLSLGS